MVEFEFKCPQCGETVIADETLCGQVQLCPNCEKGIVVPRNIPKTQSIDVEYKADVTANCQVKLKPIKRQTENTPIPQSDDGQRLSEFERMCIREQERRIREKRQTLLITSIKATVVVILICTVGVFAFSWWPYGNKRFRRRHVWPRKVPRRRRRQVVPFMPILTRGGETEECC